VQRFADRVFGGVPIAGPFDNEIVDEAMEENYFWLIDFITCLQQASMEGFIGIPVLTPQAAASEPDKVKRTLLFGNYVRLRNFTNRIKELTRKMQGLFVYHF
jgi:hypothetical protein